jgi:hypothetical protein
MENIENIPKIVILDENKSKSLLKIRTGNQCIIDAKNKPEPKMLFSVFWHEGELCICFADTNLGKSILAVQIANSISKGIPINGFNLDAIKQKVLYFDFEMGDKQFQRRYSEEYKNDYSFDDNFIRIEIDPDFTDFETFEIAVFEAIENAIKTEGAKILIIDNLTYLSAQSTEKAKDALPLMKKLKDLKLKYDLSLLVLAHTPKRNLLNPISNNDLAGSKHLANFADSIFAIGESFKEKSIRYLKQIKARATEIVFDTENVVICELQKPLNFLMFNFLNYGYEREHLKTPSESQTSEIDNAILELKKSNPNISNGEIALRLGTYKVKVGRVIKKNNETESMINKKV